MRKILLIGLAILAGGFILLQLVPYGRNHANPPVLSSDLPWDSPESEALARRACFDCHSNETVWPWYSNIAPVSWLVQRDVDEGRHRLNLSEWGYREQESGEELTEVIFNGQMPPASYLITHPKARLTEEEQHTLARGLIVVSIGGVENTGLSPAGSDAGEREGGEAAEHEENEQEGDD